ncbi:MAG: cation:proton antiporter [Rhodoglobus sp.]
MEWAAIGVVGIITIVAAGVFSKKLGIAAPLILIIVGFGFSYIPGAPVHVAHEVILTVLLPPILYAAAITVPVIDFRRNLSSISALSVALVIVSALVTGYVLFLVFPDLSLPAAIALGAVISPTDAVAATSLGKRLGLPPRLVSILEGEGLVNDATALVLLRSAIAATAGAVSIWDIAGDFLFAVTVAIVIGLLIGVVTVFVRSRLKDAVLDTSISFAVPFLAFLPAQYLGASGVLAVVAAGLYSGHSSARRFSAQARTSERLNWRSIQFILENGVFLLMGLELSYVISTVRKDELSVNQALLLGVLMTGILIVLRFAFVAPLLLVLRGQTRRAERDQSRLGAALTHADTVDSSSRGTKRVQRARKIFDRRQVDLDRMRVEGLGWRGGVVLGWSGMRGVVTLAAAQSLPLETPYRSQLVLIAFTVAVVTLLLQGGTLPAVIRWTGIGGTDSEADHRELRALLSDLSTAGTAVLENPENEAWGGAELDPQVIERVRRDSRLRLTAPSDAHAQDADPTAVTPRQRYRLLRRSVVAAEREALLDARSEGAYPSHILAQAQSWLDLEETRLDQMGKAD